MEDIKKHRNDILRLGLLLAAESRFVVPQRVHDDLGRFLDSHAPESNVWREIRMAVERTAPIEKPSEALHALRQAFVER